MDVRGVTADLVAEHEALDRVVADLPDDGWSRPTASPRWSVADQIGHLTYFDAAATLAITDPAAFDERAGELFSTAAHGDEALDDLTLHRHLAPAELLDTWRAHRQGLVDAAGGLSDGDRVPWYGPSMGAKSFVTARLMETWAHGQDVVDAVGAERPATDRLHHVAHLGSITRGWTYRNRGLEPPDTTVRVELTSPSGERWDFGPADADEVVRGDALDFCLVVTQRRHLDDTGLTVGPAGRDWLSKAQAFAGPPTDGPAPGG